MIIPVILVGIENGARAEFLIDWISQLNQRKPKGHALLVLDGTHEEYVARCRIAADLAFESHDIMSPPSKDTKEKMASAIVRRNNMFMTAAQYCQSNYRCPFLFLEPECTPTNPQWLEKIEDAYNNQPHRYLLTHLRDSDTSPRFPFPCGVFHMGLFNDISKACADAPEVPWERVAGENIIGRSTKSRLFEPLKIQDEADFSKVWPEAQIVVGDTSGALVEHFREKGVHLPKLTFGSLDKLCETLVEHPVSEAFRGPMTLTTKIDGRTKAGRAAKKALNGNHA